MTVSVRPSSEDLPREDIVGQKISQIHCGTGVDFASHPLTRKTRIIHGGSIPADSVHSTFRETTHVCVAV